MFELAPVSPMSKGSYIVHSGVHMLILIKLKGVVNCQGSPRRQSYPWVGQGPISIIILNMRFLSKASLRASSQITASSYILERHLWVNNSKLFALAPTWSLACKQTDYITVGMLKLLDPKHVLTCPVNTKHLYDFMQCWTNVEDVGPNILCLLGRRTFSQTLYIYSMLVQCWASVADVGLALKQHWINVLFK